MRSAFSFIELLVVVIVLALLASMVLPVIGMVRSSARTLACAGQLRQIGVAQLGWRSDHQGKLLPGDPFATAYGSACVWPSCISGKAIFALHDDFGVPFKTWMCPATRGELTWVSMENTPLDEAMARGWTYGGRAVTRYQWLAALPACTQPWVIKPRQELDNPRTMLAADFAARPGTSGFQLNQLFNHQRPAALANALFMDGRVRSFREPEMVVYYTNWIDFLAAPADS